MGEMMKVESIIAIFGVLAIVISYILLLIAFTVLEESKTFYVISAFGGIVIGTVLLGLSKMIIHQEELVKQLDALNKLTRLQVKALTELSAAKNPKAAKTNQTTQTTQATAVSVTNEVEKGKL